MNVHKIWVLTSPNIASNFLGLKRPYYNERPMVYNRNIEDGIYFSPSDLLLGRASARLPAGPFRQYSSLKRRHDFIKSIVDCFCSA